jgi:hypothetical protein
MSPVEMGEARREPGKPGVTRAAGEAKLMYGEVEAMERARRYDTVPRRGDMVRREREAATAASTTAATGVGLLGEVPHVGGVDRQDEQGASRQRRRPGMGRARQRDRGARSGGGLAVRGRAGETGAWSRKCGVARGCGLAARGHAGEVQAAGRAPGGGGRRRGRGRRLGEVAVGQAVGREGGEGETGSGTILRTGTQCIA